MQRHYESALSHTPSCGCASDGLWGPRYRSPPFDGQHFFFFSFKAPRPSPTRQRILYCHIDPENRSLGNSCGHEGSILPSSSTGQSRAWSGSGAPISQDTIWLNRVGLRRSAVLRGCQMPGRTAWPAIRFVPCTVQWPPLPLDCAETIQWLRSLSGPSLLLHSSEYAWSCSASAGRLA